MLFFFCSKNCSTYFKCLKWYLSSSHCLIFFIQPKKISTKRMQQIFVLNENWMKNTILNECIMMIHILNNSSFSFKIYWFVCYSIGGHQFDRKQNWFEIMSTCENTTSKTPVSWTRKPFWCSPSENTFLHYQFKQRFSITYDSENCNKKRLKKLHLSSHQWKSREFQSMDLVTLKRVGVLLYFN